LPTKTPLLTVSPQWRLAILSSGYPVSRKTAAMTRPLSILIVDDNRDCADSLALIVQLWGHRPVVAYSGQAALEIAREEPPDLAILDLRMPLMNGYELATRLREEPGLTSLTMVALTGEDTNQEASEKCGFTCHLVKPNHLPALEQLLASTPVG
jgi:CheY-like chemotaxis protein